MTKSAAALTPTPVGKKLRELAERAQKLAGYSASADGDPHPELFQSHCALDLALIEAALVRIERETDIATS